MSGLVVCLLALDGWAAAESTLASIRGHGLAIAVGVIGEEHGERPPGIEVHGLEWQDDFADARNQLAQKLSADWLLWLNDDEELIDYAEPDLEQPFAGVWIEDSEEYTPRLAVRLQGPRGVTRWTGALHENLLAEAVETVAIVDGIRLRSRGERVRERLERHHAMAARGCGGYGAALAEARYATMVETIGKDFMPWLRAYKMAAALGLRPLHPDPRVEPAIRLCDCDYTAPALSLVAEKADNVGLHFAILFSNLVTERGRLEGQIKDLARRLWEGRFDRRYSIRRGLESGTNRQILMALKACLIGEFDQVFSQQIQSATAQVGRYRIIPVSAAGAARGRFQIRLDAGLTFGTGNHPATRGALCALDKLARRRKFRRVLDFGCGSGILAIAAAKAWPARVSALDINPVAVEQTRRNVRANALGGRVRAGTSYGLRYGRLPRGEMYDLVLINLEAKHTIRFGRPLLRRLAAGGIIVFTGFTVGDQGRIASFYRALGLRLRSVLGHYIWPTLIMEAPGATKRQAVRHRARYRLTRR